MLIRSIPLPTVASSGMRHSLRFQLLVTLCFGVGLPFLVLIGIPDAGHFANKVIAHSSIAAASAAILMVFFLRRLAHYPGVRAVRYILPTLGILYGLILSIVTLFRLEYSNQILLSCFLSTLITRYFIAALVNRSVSRPFCVVPGGRASRIGSLQPVQISLLSEPAMPEERDIALIADLHHDHDPRWERFLAEAAIGGTPVFHYKQVWESVTGKVQIEHLSENSFGSLIPGLAYRKLKRFADFVLCIVALPFLLPLFALVAALIRRETPGPAFFRQKRMGYRGDIFQVIKFRTMAVTHDGEDVEQAVTLPDDQRVTRIGRFLRRTRIDELPQVFNILRGEMSWIGPRPEAISLSQLYEEKLPFYRYRHIVRPGISGWAQVNQGHVADLGEVDDKLQYDFYYIKNFSYWLDLLIAFRSLHVMVSGFGAK